MVLYIVIVLMCCYETTHSFTGWGLGPTFSKLLRNILGRFLILGKLWENINDATMMQYLTSLFLRLVGSYYVTFLLDI